MRVHHIGYLTDGGYDVNLTSLQENGYLMVQPSEKAAALKNRLAAFMMNSETGLIELIEDFD